MSEIKTHAYEIISLAVDAVINNSIERGFPVHGAVYSEWGVGKTIACRQVAQEKHQAFYVKVAGDGTLTAPRLLKDMLYAMGIGPMRSFQDNLKLLERVITAKGLLTPVFILDEFQTVASKPTILSFLKDLSENPQISACYLFVGDESLEGYLKGSHSLYERVKIKRRIPKMTKETALKLAKRYEIKLPDGFMEVINSLGSTTLDVDFALYLAKKAQINELDKKTFKALLLKVKEGAL